MAAQLQGISLSMPAIRSKTMGRQNRKSSNRGSQGCSARNPGTQRRRNPQVCSSIFKVGLSEVWWPNWPVKVDQYVWTLLSAPTYIREWKRGISSFSLGRRHSIVVLKIRTRSTGLTMGRIQAQCKLCLQPLYLQLQIGRIIKTSPNRNSGGISTLIQTARFETKLFTSKQKFQIFLSYLQEKIAVEVKIQKP